MDLEFARALRYADARMLDLQAGGWEDHKSYLIAKELVKGEVYDNFKSFADAIRGGYTAGSELHQKWASVFAKYSPATGKNKGVADSAPLFAPQNGNGKPAPLTRRQYIDVYRNLADQNLPIPDDEVFAVISGCSNSTAGACRYRLREDGYEFAKAPYGWACISYPISEEERKRQEEERKRAEAIQHLEENIAALTKQHAAQIAMLTDQLSRLK